MRRLDPDPQGHWQSLWRLSSGAHFRPLDMSTARIINEADIIPNRAAGYRLVKGELKKSGNGSRL